MIRIRVVAAVLALAAATGTAGCARPDDLQALAAQDDAAVGSDVLATIVGQVYGTPDQREAGEQRQFYSMHAAWGQCMAGKGVDYEVPTYVSGGRGLVGPGLGDLLAWSPRRDDFGIARRIEQLATTGTPENPAFLKLTTDAQRDQWIKAQADCQDAANVAQDMDLPEAFPAINHKLLVELKALQEQYAPNLVTTYTQCMATAGVTVEEGSTADVYMAANQKFPPADAQQPFDPTTLPGWAEAVAFEKAAATADWTCRGDDATRVIAASGDQLSTWAADNGQQLSQIAAAWAAMPDEAAQAKSDAVKATTK